MIGVIPFGKRRGNTILFAARALQVHTPIDRLVVVGAEPPPKLSPDEWIPSHNNGNPHSNTNRHLLAAANWAKTQGVTEFVWTADDTFPLADWEPVCHVRKYSIVTHLSHYPKIAGYSNLIRRNLPLMEADGLDPTQVPCGSIHRPMLVNVDRTLTTLDRIGPAGHFKSLYVAGLEDVVPAGDPKVRGRRRVSPNADCVSCDRQSWRYHAGQVVKRRFTEPSRWENPPS